MAQDAGRIEPPASPDEPGVIPHDPARPQRVLQILLSFWTVATPFAVAAAMYGGSSHLATVACVLGSIGAVGAMRRLYWGQMLLLTAHLFASLFLLFESVPDWDAKLEDLTRLQFLVTTQVPRPWSIALVIAICILPMIPLMFVARPAAWYRRAWW